MTSAPHFLVFCYVFMSSKYVSYCLSLNLHYRLGCMMNDQWKKIDTCNWVYATVICHVCISTLLSVLLHVTNCPQEEGQDVDINKSKRPVMLQRKFPVAGPIKHPVEHLKVYQSYESQVSQRHGSGNCQRQEINALLNKYYYLQLFLMLCSVLSCY